MINLREDLPCDLHEERAQVIVNVLIGTDRGLE